MRAAYLILLALVGCTTLSQPPPIPAPPAAPSSVANLNAAQDKVDGKVAAAVTVARENADKPHVVDSELSVALSLLDKPSDSELALARQRSEKATPAEYEAARKFGAKLLASLDAAQAKAEADIKEAARISALKDARIADLENKLKDADHRFWLMLGGGLIAAGAVAWAFLSMKAAMPFLICGAYAGALPSIFDSKWFAWASGIAVVSVLAVGVWHLYEVTKTPPPPADDEQTPPKV